VIDHAVILATQTTAFHGKLNADRSTVMLPALGKPIVVRVMDALHRAGINQFTVIIGITEGNITSYLQSHWVPDANIAFVLKAPNQSLDDTLSQIAAKLQRPFLFTSYNCFTHRNYFKTLLAQHEQQPDDIILTGATSMLSPSETVYRAAISGNQILAIEPFASDHPILLTNIAIFGSDFSQHLAAQTTSQVKSQQILDVITHYQKVTENRVIFSQTSWFLQVESDYDLLLLNRHLLEDGHDAHILSEMPQSVQVVPPVRVDPQVSVGAGCVIGPNVFLERGSSLGSDVTIQDAMVLTNANIKPGTQVKSLIATPNGFIEL